MQIAELPTAQLGQTYHLGIASSVAPDAVSAVPTADGSTPKRVG